MIFHVTINGTQYEVNAETASSAICIALDTYGDSLSNEPDACLLGAATHGLCVCAEYAGELNPEASVNP